MLCHLGPSKMKFAKEQRLPVSCPLPRSQQSVLSEHPWNGHTRLETQNRILRPCWRRSQGVICSHTGRRGSLCRQGTEQQYTSTRTAATAMTAMTHPHGIPASHSECGPQTELSRQPPEEIKHYQPQFPAEETEAEVPRGEGHVGSQT